MTCTQCFQPIGEDATAVYLYMGRLNRWPAIQFTGVVWHVACAPGSAETQEHLRDVPAIGSMDDV